VLWRKYEEKAVKDELVYKDFAIKFTLFVMILIKMDKIVKIRPIV